MRLLVLCPYYPPHMGGVENYASQLNEALAEQPEVLSVTVVTAQLPKGTLAEERIGNVRVLRYPAIEPVANFPVPMIWRLAYWQTLKKARRDQSTLIFSHTRFFLSSLLAYRLSRRWHKAWIHIEHGSDFVQSTNWLITRISRFYDKILGRRILQQADHVVSISQAVAKFVAALAGVDSTVIYRGVDQKLIEKIPVNHQIRTRYVNKVIVYYLGRLIEGKGVADLIAAAQILDNPSLVFLLAGDGPQKAGLKKAVETTGLITQVRFLGAQPFRQAISIMKAADIFVNPSYTEGLPTTIIEAALCRKAIIATDVGGTKEIIRNNQSGILIEPRRPEIIARSINRLIKDRELAANFGMLVDQTVKKRFNWEINAEAFLKVCRQVTGSKRHVIISRRLAKS